MTPKGSEAGLGTTDAAEKERRRRGEREAAPFTFGGHAFAYRPDAAAVPLAHGTSRAAHFAAAATLAALPQPP